MARHYDILAAEGALGQAQSVRKAEASACYRPAATIGFSLQAWMQGVRRGTPR